MHNTHHELGRRMDSEINVIAELELAGVPIKWAGEDEVNVKCPFHDGDNPESCGVNVAKRMFRCRIPDCGATGDIVKLLARFCNPPKTRAEMILQLGTRYKLEEVKVIQPDVVERLHKDIWEAKPFISALHARGVTDDLIRKHRIGCDGRRIMIPIFNEMGSCVNIRKYLPGAPTRKMLDTRGHSKRRLYPADQLTYDRIVLCGGECKAIVAAQQLNPYGVGAVTVTGGEGQWEPYLLPLIAGKYVYICLDVDDAGMVAAQTLALMIHRAVAEVYIINLPLDRDVHPKGDINDFIAGGGVLFPLIDRAEQWLPPVTEQVVDAEPIPMLLEAAVHADNVGKRIEFTGVVTMLDAAPYAIPSTVKVACDRAQRECSACAVFASNRDTFQIHPENPAILEMIQATRRDQRESIMRATGVPVTCRSFKYGADAYYNCEDSVISPELDITSISANRTQIPTICIGKNIELNESYKMIGRLYPDPKTQQQKILVSSYEPTQDALSTYKVHDMAALRKFSPAEWTADGIAEKLADIYGDLEANVTHIYQRRDLHLTVDLAYHSPLLLRFDGAKPVKGWVEVCIVGDSAQGKSDTAIGLQTHYNLGHKVECKNTTGPGLLGGCETIGGRWFVSWGVVPQNDRRLIIFEELKGMPTDVWARLTDMRSSGQAEITKIVKRKTNARARMIVISNPRKLLNMAAYNFGIEAIRELIGNLEDVRRFDCACIVAAGEIPEGTLNRLKSERPVVPHNYTSEMCRSLVLWTWTRGVEDVIFEQAAVTEIMHTATAMCREFTEMIPLVDGGSMRYKLAKLAASLAGRTYSADETGERLIVRAAHVQYIAEYLRRMYSNPVFGYREFTAAMSGAEALIEPEMILSHLNATPNAIDLVMSMLNASEIDQTDFENWCGWNQEQAKAFLSFLCRRQALKREKRIYKKTAEFVQFLKASRDGGKLVKRPDYLPHVDATEFA